MKYNDLLDDLQNLTGKKPKQRELAEALDINIGAIGHRAMRNSSFSYAEVNAIKKFFNCGENSPICNNDNEDVITIDYYPDVFGSCGSGTFVLSEQREKLNVPKKLISNYSKVKSYSIINAYGDSMQPYIYDKDKLIIEFNDGEQIIDNRVYVFRLGDNIFIKRLSLNINELVIKSDNKDYNTKIVPLADADIQIIGKVIGLFRSMN